MTSRLLAACQQGPLILDAAMGTRLLAKGLDLRVEDPCLWNLTHPDDVLEVHRRDVAAGARILFTNTFGANGFWLSNYGCSQAVAAINRRAVALARRAAGVEGFVAGDIGPSAAERPGAAAEQAAILVRAGVDALVFETYRAEPVARVLREVQGLRDLTPVLVSLWEWPDPPDSTARRLLDLGAAVLGMNCQHGMDAARTFSQRLGPAISCPLLVKPSAATAARPASGSSPAAFAAAVPGLVERNVRLLGGCCGTTEDHVAALAAACAPYQGILPHSLTGAGP